MSNTLLDQARTLVREFKGDRYVFGLDCLDGLGTLARSLGLRSVVVADGLGQRWAETVHSAVFRELARGDIQVVEPVVAGAQPNAPRPDVFRMVQDLKKMEPEFVVAVGGGSTIDAVKAAVVLAVLGDRCPDIEEYFGAGRVTAMLQQTGRRLTPVLAVQIAASSAAHLTKYSNITDPATCQKKLIIDDAIVPPKAMFDYSTSISMPPGFTADGALDGLSHCLEVFFGAKGDALEKVRPIAATGIELVVSHVAAACRDGANRAAREALGLGTDLGGYAIMIGGTNGAHLTSFSLVDLLSHGRACAMMNPYYTVFFAPAIEPQLRAVAEIFRRAGHLRGDTDRLHGRDLGRAVAEAMIALSASIGFPTRLSDVPGFGEEHVRRALAAAKNPQLASKLQNMPVALSAETVDEFMGPVLEAATSGDFSVLKNQDFGGLATI
jgi:alcohol dehydrogenase class IV